MTLDPAILVQVGGWVFSGLVCGFIIAGFVHGDLVPGWIHKREIARADRAADLLDRMTTGVENLSGQLKTLIGLSRR